MQSNLTGQQLGSYILQRLLGVGGMAEVYLAYHERLPNRPVALKVLLPHLTTPEFLKRFNNEAAWLSQLQHRNIVQVYDAGQAEGRWYIAQEYLDGEPLDQTLDRLGRLPFDNAAWFAIQVADALDYAHSSCGLIHRDIKPGNIMLLRDGTTVKLLDFGIAAVLWGDRKAPTPIGTLNYAAPEQVRGQADHLSDVYSLGATLYEMVVGRSPQWGHGSQLIPPGRLAPPGDLPPQLEQLIVRALDSNPARRPHSAYEMAAELRQMRTAWRQSGERQFSTQEIPIPKKSQTPTPPRPALPRRAAGSPPGARRMRTPRPAGQNPAWPVLLLAGLSALVIVALILGASAQRSRVAVTPVERIITQAPGSAPWSYTVTPGARPSPTLTPVSRSTQVEPLEPADGATFPPGRGPASLKWSAQWASGQKFKLSLDGKEYELTGDNVTLLGANQFGYARPEWKLAGAGAHIWQVEIVGGDGGLVASGGPWTFTVQAPTTLPVVTLQPTTAPMLPSCQNGKEWNGTECVCPKGTVWDSQKQWCADTDGGPKEPTGRRP